MWQGGNQGQQNRPGLSERHTGGLGLGGLPTTGLGDRLPWQRVGYSGSLEFRSRVERLIGCISCSEAPHVRRLHELCSVSWSC